MWARSKVAALFHRCLGEEGATKLIEAQCEKLRLGPTLTQEQVIHLLEGLVPQKDIVGITAGLAKARIHLSRIHQTENKT